MGHATSSALRADKSASAAPVAAAANDPYGSLSGLGAPRKFKKKPVLVLDAEELAKAHAMFQDAQAEILGAETPREAPRPSSLLGLAPMDDDDTPEDRGSDENGDGIEDDTPLPNADDVLKMTRSRGGMSEEEQAFAAQALEDGFDETNRIFPTLPVKNTPEPQVAEPPPAAPPAPLSDSVPPVGEIAPQQVGPVAVPLEAEDRDNAFSPESESSPAVQSIRRSLFERMAAGEETAKPAPAPSQQHHEAEERPEPVPPAEDIAALSPQPVEPPAPPAIAPKAEPAFDMPVKPEEFEVDIPGEASEVVAGEPSPPLPEEDTDHSFADSEAVDVGVEITDYDDADGDMDGTAFMYANSSRGRINRVAAEGRANGLRARLVRERQAQPEDDQDAASIWSRFGTWLRGLFA